MPHCTSLLLLALQVEVASQLAAAQAEVATVQQTWSLGISQEQLTLEHLQQQEAQLAAGSDSLSSGIFNALASPKRVAALLTRSWDASTGSSVESNPRQPLPGGESPLRGAAAEGGDCRGSSLDRTGSPCMSSMLSQGSEDGVATEGCTPTPCPNSDSSCSRISTEASSEVRGQGRVSADPQDGAKQREGSGPDQPARWGMGWPSWETPASTL